MKYVVVGLFFLISFICCKKKDIYRCYNFNDSTEIEFNSQMLKFKDDAEMYIWRQGKDYFDANGDHISIYCTRELK